MSCDLRKNPTYSNWIPTRRGAKLFLFCRKIFLWVHGVVMVIQRYSLTQVETQDMTHAAPSLSFFLIFYAMPWLKRAMPLVSLVLAHDLHDTCT